MMFLKNFMIVFAALFAFALPIGLLIWWKMKTDAKLWPFIVGAVCFLVFAMGLEQILHTFCLVEDNAVSRAINANPVLYAIYGAFAAGIFEETGRLFGYRVLLRKRRTAETSVAYGIGHGGIEVIILLGSVYLIYALSVFGVSLGDASADASVREVINQLSPGIMGVACFERIAAVTLQIALSVYVFYSVRTGKARWFLFAVLLHALTDFPAALCQKGILPVWAIELWCAVLALVMILRAAKIYRVMKEKDEEDKAAEGDNLLEVRA